MSVHSGFSLLFFPSHTVPLLWHELSPWVSVLQDTPAPAQAWYGPHSFRSHPAAPSPMHASVASSMNFRGYLLQFHGAPPPPPSLTLVFPLVFLVLFISTSPLSVWLADGVSLWWLYCRGVDKIFKNSVLVPVT